MNNCSDEIIDCDLTQMGFEQLFRKLLRLDGDCLYLNTTPPTSGGSSTPAESTVTTEEVTAVTTVALFAAYQAWKTANPTRKVVRELAFTNPDGLPSIYISHTA